MQTLLGSVTRESAAVAAAEAAGAGGVATDTEEELDVGELSVGGSWRQAAVSVAMTIGNRMR
jgi:hypothetical protein